MDISYTEETDGKNKKNTFSSSTIFYNLPSQKIMEEKELVLSNKKLIEIFKMKIKQKICKVLEG